MSYLIITARGLDARPTRFVIRGQSWLSMYTYILSISPAIVFIRSAFWGLLLTKTKCDRNSRKLGIIKKIKTGISIVLTRIIHYSIDNRLTTT